jgi:hypothetical protein
MKHTDVADENIEQGSAGQQIARAAAIEVTEESMLPEGFSDSKLADVRGKQTHKPDTGPDSEQNNIGDHPGVAMKSFPFSKHQTSSALGNLAHAEVSGKVKERKVDGPPGEKEKQLFDDQSVGRVGANFTLPTVRPEYIIPGEDAVAMSAYEQLRGDIEFDLFSVVKDGYGLGATNQLHIDNKRNEQFVRYKGKLYHPRAPDGPEMGMHPTRSELHPTMSNREMARPRKKLRRLLSATQQYIRSMPGGASSQFLPDDNNTLMSSTGLGTRKPSPMLPHIDTHYYWQKQYDPAGIHMRNHKMRKTIDPLRNPQKSDVGQRGTVRHNESWRRHPITYGGY